MSVEASAGQNQTVQGDGGVGSGTGEM